MNAPETSRAKKLTDAVFAMSGRSADMSALAESAMVSKLTSDLANAKDAIAIRDKQIDAKDAEIARLLRDHENTLSKFADTESNLRKQIDSANEKLLDERSKHATELASRIASESMLAAEAKAHQAAEDRCTALIQAMSAPRAEATPYEPASYTMQVADRDGNGGIRTVRLVPEKSV